jgi:transcriptional regulator with XRE-family HTH domain
VKRASQKSRPSAATPSDEELQIGPRLKHARLIRRMRLSEVAAISECSESLISKIENGKATPSLNTLHRLAKALGTTIAALLGDATAVNGVVMRGGERPVLSRLGLGGKDVDGVETELLIPFGARSALQATLVRVQPDAVGDGFRQHDGDEVGYVISGEIVLTVAGVSYRLRAGDAFFFPSMEPHAVANPGKTIAEIVWVNTPPSL